jgi:steroid 5-alpha reductase family enzyme
VSFLLAIVPMSADGLPLRRLIVALVVALWGARLGTHIWKRSRHKGNDPRYLSLIEQWGAQAAMRMFLFLQIQALCSLPLMLSIACAAHHRAPDFGPIDVLACAVAVVAVVGEAIADEQLRRFAATRSGVCDIGLWRYSRHPNYFFEFLLWCAFPLFALSGTVGFASVAALAGPLCMYWLLVYVSGVPPLEDHMLVSRGEAYRAYQQRTAMFFPLPPHNQA